MSSQLSDQDKQTRMQFAEYSLLILMGDVEYPKKTIYSDECLFFWPAV